MQPPKIEIKNVSKVFYKNILDKNQTDSNETLKLTSFDKQALKNIDVTFNAGDIIGIVGCNGAGKSTLLSIIAGISNQTQGQISIHGKVTAVLTLGVGLREDLTGRENIYLDGELQGKSRAEIDAIMDKIIDFSELKDFIDRPIKIYSTGMKSRLAFSMLVEIEPEILIIDEALSAGDVFFAEKALKKIKEICQKGKIVLLVSHSMSTINTMCNRCLWMEKGEIIMDDAPSVVTHQYLEKIKNEDALIDISTNRADVSKILNGSNFKILDVVLKQKGRQRAQNIFDTFENFLIEVVISRLEILYAHLHITIERIDGMVLHYHNYDISQIEIKKNSHAFIFELSLDSMFLNKGFYQLKIELSEKETITNYFTRLFEVRNNQMPSGGAPLLRYLAEITLDNEDSTKCLDLIELTTE